MLLDDISDLLSTGGVTTTIYKGFMPEQPSDAFVLTETGGQGPIHAMSTGRTTRNAIGDGPTGWPEGAHDQRHEIFLRGCSADTAFSWS